MTIKLRTLALSFGLCVLLPLVSADLALAKEGKGKGRSDRHEHGRVDGPGGGPYINVNVNFVEADRRVIYDYYGDVARYGKCPPGLAKKHNGCLPPGQAKKWLIGRALPREVVYYPVPPNLLVRISAPPPGYKYVRVASDILLIAAGTGMVAAEIGRAHV